MIFGYIVLNLCLLGVLLWARLALVRFLNAYSAIENPAALEAFKNIARWNMYGALAFLACGAVTWVWGYFIIRQYGFTGFLAVIIFSIILLILGLSMKKLENKSRSLKCNSALQAEYKRISEIWVKKAFPDF